MYSSKGGRGGSYYKNKYGRGGGGKPAEGGSGRKRHLSQGGTYDDLLDTLRRIDQRPYGYYHDLETGHSGGWKHDGDVDFVLQILHAQSDSYAPPTQCRLTVPYTKTQLPETFLSTATRRMATADYLWRKIYHVATTTMGADRKLENGKGWSGPKGGDIQVLPPTQHVIEQTAVFLEGGSSKYDTVIVCQLTINLPAQGRTIMGDAAIHIFDQLLPKLIRTSFYLGSSSECVNDMKQHVDSIEDQLWLQDQLEPDGLVCFVLNGAILPRRSGVDDRPLIQDLDDTIPVVPFQSPPSLERSFILPNARRKISGMGIPEGITLICGGGFHGKSTLLECLQLGVYAKIPGDGREFCVTRKNAAKIRAEDGRYINKVDISSFIRNLPFQKDTTQFTTNDASGSTSQACNIVEAIELGTDTLLIDEDTCATNFMIRDEKMMRLVARDKEPITPFIRVVKPLKDQQISTILVVGGSGDFFEVADLVLLMDSYRCEDATSRAQEIIQFYENQQQNRLMETFAETFKYPRSRYPVPDILRNDGRVKVISQNVLQYGEDEIDLSSQEQLVSWAQVNAIGYFLQYVSREYQGKRMRIREILDDIKQDAGKIGLPKIANGTFDGRLVMPRSIEIGAAVNRLRRHCMQQDDCWEE